MGVNPHSGNAIAVKRLTILATGVLMLAGNCGSQGSPSNEGVSPRRLTLNQSAAAVDKEATHLAQLDKFAGAVLLAQGGKILLNKAYGFADRGNHVLNTTDTKFRIGSMGKMFTAVAILQLAEKEKLDIGAPIGQYLSDYPNTDVATQVTIRQLLTHTGGTGDIFTPEYEKQRLDIRTLADYVKLFGSRGLAFQPGSQWAYSNYGYILLGRIIEKVAGMSYYDYVRIHIFEPLGMIDTDSVLESVDVLKRSIGYTAKHGVWVNNIDTLPWRGTSAGGGYSTVRDLYRFAQGLCGGKLVNSESVEKMISKQVKNARMPPSSAYGFGVHVSEGPQGKSFGNTGGAPGMNGELEVYIRTNTVVVALANLDPPSAMQLVDFFAQRMPTD